MGNIVASITVRLFDKRPTSYLSLSQLLILRAYVNAKKSSDSNMLDHMHESPFYALDAEVGLSKKYQEFKRC